MSLGVAAALGTVFFPGTLLAIGPILVVMLLAARRRGRGLAIAVAGAITTAALLFTVLPSIVDAPAAELSSSIGSDDVWSILRLAPGGGPGTWVLASFLPIAALLCFAIVGSELCARAWRALGAALTGLGLAWASAARWWWATAASASAPCASCSAAPRAGAARPGFRPMQKAQARPLGASTALRTPSASA